MSDDIVREALAQALKDVQVPETFQAPKPAAHALVKGRFDRSTGQCVQCGKVQAQHGVKCSADEYAEHRAALLAACKSGTPAPDGDYAAWRSANPGDLGTQSALKLARMMPEGYGR